MKKIIGVLFGLTAVVAGFSQAFDKVKVESGLIAGGVNAAGDVHYFKGIPFAAPPVGQLRWKAPHPAAPWDGVRNCTQFGPSPMQNKPIAIMMWTEEYNIPPMPVSEDCLYLNIWTAAKTSNERRPVIIYVFGGGFISGGGNVPIYDGEAIAKKGVVYVTINYRVGVFGFLAHPGLSKESGHHSSGNYGLMDQIAALKWVQNNIAAFGGDPRNVTIAGESAGSMSVNCLVASPLAKGLFVKAIGESGANFSRENMPLAAAEVSGEKLAHSLGANTVEDLRAIPADTLQEKAMVYSGPIIDGYVLPEPVADIYIKNKENPVALLTGWNEDEGLLFGPAEKAADFKQALAKQFAPDSVAALQYYSADNDVAAEASQLKLFRDMTFGRQNYAWANIMSAQGNKVYVYRFSRQPPTVAGQKNWGAFHAAEIAYAYNNLKFVKRPFETADYTLAETMSTYWVNFAKTGDPNGAGLPQWPLYSRNNGNIILLGTQVTAGVLPDKAALEFHYNRIIKN